MDSLLRTLILTTFLLGPTVGLAAGDYIWEEKFNRELPKAEQGDSTAQYAVAEMYERGRGAVKDLDKAFEWYSKAAAQGNAKAAYKVGAAYLKGEGTTKDYGKALTWLKKSSDAGYVRSYFHLGEIYEEGMGVKTDYDEALRWYKLALQGGYSSAADSIKRVAEAQKILEEQQRTRNERLSKATEETKVKEEAKPAPPPPAPVVKKRLSTKERILLGGWKKRSTPSEYLPSAATDCKDEGSRIVCMSHKLQRDIGTAMISYETKAVIFSLKDDGSFKISYRNNVMEIKPHDSENAQPQSMETGWQETDHKLECQLEDDHHLTCLKNKTRDIELTR